MIGSTSGDTRFVDSSVQAGTAYTYRVRARDRAGPRQRAVGPARRPAELGGLPRHVRVGQPGGLDDARRRGRRDACGPPCRCERPAGVGLRRPRERQQDAGDDVRHPRGPGPRAHHSTSTQANLVTFANGAGERIVTVFSQNAAEALLRRPERPGAVTTKCQSHAPTSRIDDGAWHTLRVRATTGASPALTVRARRRSPVPAWTGRRLWARSPIARLAHRRHHSRPDIPGRLRPGRRRPAADRRHQRADGAAGHQRQGRQRPAGERRLGARQPTTSASPAIWSSATGSRSARPARRASSTGRVDGLASYVYTVRARDAAGNVSLPSAGASVDTPIVLRERFDTAASLRRFAPAAGLRWDAASQALRLPSNAHGRIALPGATSRLYARIKFRIVTRGANAVPLLSLRSATGAVLSAGLNAGGASERRGPPARSGTTCRFTPTSATPGVAGLPRRRGADGAHAAAARRAPADHGDRARRRREVRRARRRPRGEHEVHDRYRAAERAARLGEGRAVAHRRAVVDGSLGRRRRGGIPHLPRHRRDRAHHRQGPQVRRSRRAGQAPVSPTVSARSMRPATSPPRRRRSCASRGCRSRDGASCGRSARSA